MEAQRLPLDEQEASLKDLLASAPDQEQARQVRFELARIALKTGAVEEARDYFQSLWNEDQSDAVASRALYELGRLASDHDGNWPRARQLLLQAITETAPWAGADFALDFLLRKERRLGAFDELATLLQKAANDASDGRIAARLHLERGRILATERAAYDEALAAYRAAYARCENCAATDDALMEMAAIYARFQMWEPAIDALSIVAERYQPSFFVGTYSSHRVSDARFALAEIELLYRQNYGAATEHLQIFLSRFPDDQRADDAAWHLVQIRRLKGQQAGFERALRRFLRDYPESRYATEATRQLEELM